MVPVNNGTISEEETASLSSIEFSSDSVSQPSPGIALQNSPGLAKQPSQTVSKRLTLKRMTQVRMDQFEKAYQKLKPKDSYYTFNQFQQKHAFNFRNIR